MKRFFFVILFLMGSFSLFAESAKSIEGVVEVAGKGELPSGYFGKTAGYLPGDSVSITNPNTGMTLQILNLGTLDESSGVAILVSEETANSLGIERNSGVKVRLAKRSGFFDENVSGDAVLDKSTLQEEVLGSEEESDAVRVAGVPLIEDEEEVEAEEEDAVEAFLSSDKDDFDAYEEEDEEEIDAGDDEEGEDEDLELEEEEEIEEEDLEEEDDDEDDESELVIVEYPEDGTYLEDREDIEQPSPAEESEAEDEVEADFEDEETDEEEGEIYEKPVIIDYPESLEEEEDEEEIEEDFDEESEDDELEEEEELEEEDLETEEEEDDEYMPIILVPTEPETPPESEDDELEEEEELEEEVPVEPEHATETTSSDLASHLLESENMLERNCYYVQFATFSSAANAESTLGKFSKYPIAVVKTKDSYRMLVGPLSVDEYGAVLARLKDVGFKDAFVVKR